MTKVFISHISNLDDNMSNYNNYLSDYRKNKINCLKSKKDKKLSAIPEILLSRYLGKKADYYIDNNNKPRCKDIEFNFSHSGDYGVCAISLHPVGVDVQKIRNLKQEVAKKFSKSEYENILKSENPTNSFFETWTKKESCLKALGLGLKAGLDFNCDNIPDYKFTFFDDIPEYKLCVCSKDPVEFIILSKI